MKKKVMALAICTALLLTGCGDKTTEEITDYGVSTSTQSTKPVESSTTASTEEAGTDEKTTGQTGKKTDELPERQNGGTPIWEDTFSIGNVPAEISIDHVSREMDYLHSYKMHDIVEDQIREEEIVKNMFGDTGTEVKRTLSEKEGDNYYLVGFVQGLYGSIHPEATTYDGKSEVPSWEDGEDMFYHTYEGTYLGLTYYLNISYSKLSREKQVAFYPKNPGDLVDAPALTDIQPLPNHIEGINTEIWSGKNVWEEMKDRPNRTQSSPEQLIASAKNFAEGICRIPVSEDDMKVIVGQDEGDPVQNEIFFFSEDEAEKGNLDGAVLDGYEVQLDLLHSGTSDMRYWMLGNSGSLWVNDKGVFAGYIKTSFEMEEQIADHVQILEFDNLMEAVREMLKSEFDPTKVNGQKLKINNAVLMYFPVESEEDPHEYTLVPAWAFTAESNGKIGYIVVNAVDGSKLMIMYTQ